MKPDNLAVPGNPDGFVSPVDGTIATPDGAANTGSFPLMGALNPQRGRDWGMEFQYRF